MPKVINIAKLTLAFVVIAGGFSLILGSLMGGGYSSSSSRQKQINDDPRSIMVQAVLIEADPGAVQSLSIPSPGVRLSDSAFNELHAEADRLRTSEGAHVRTPAMLVQHAESGSIAIKLGDRAFDADVSPSVIDTKHGPVLRVAIEIQRADSDSSSAPREMRFATAYTTAPGSVVVLDLADLGAAGTRAVLALRTTLSDPTPAPAN